MATAAAPKTAAPTRSVMLVAISSIKRIDSLGKAEDIAPGDEFLEMPEEAERLIGFGAARAHAPAAAEE